MYRGCLAFAAALFFVNAALGESLTVEVVHARSGHDPRTGQPLVSITFRDGRAFGRLTEENAGRTMEMHLNGRVIFRSVIREPILGGILQISGVELTQAQTLVDLLSEGAKLEVEIVPP